MEYIKKYLENWIKRNTQKINFQISLEDDTGFVSEEKKYFYEKTCKSCNKNRNMYSINSTLLV